MQGGNQQPSCRDKFRVDDLEGTAIARLCVTRTKPWEGFSHGGAVPFSARGSDVVDQITLVVIDELTENVSCCRRGRGGSCEENSFDAPTRQASNRSPARYFNPVSTATVATTLAGPNSRASCTAAAMFSALDVPTSRPSSRARRFAMSRASASSTHRASSNGRFPPSRRCRSLNVICEGLEDYGSVW